MKPCLKAREIKKEIRKQLPVIDELTFKDHFCSECLYYAGRIDKQPHCMQSQCSWDEEEESFHPILRKMIPIIDEEFEKAEAKYLEAKRRKETIYSMFEKEMLQERKKKDPCYKCTYGSQAPCIGFCYKQMTARPVDPNEME